MENVNDTEHAKEEIKDKNTKDMKNIHYIIEGVLAVAIIVLFALQFSSGKKTSFAANVALESNLGSNIDLSGVLPIAYINVDSLLENYNYAQDLFSIHMRSQENAQLNLSEKMHDLEKDANEFQRKVANNVFLSRERAQQEEQRILRKQQDVEELRNRTANDLMQEQERLNRALRDTIVSQLKVYNIDKRFHFIMSNTSGDNILLSEEVYNITDEVIELLNKNYSPAAK
ncbi:Outer membrane protein [Bacteroidales bacterium Barb6XT]|nr:Outer membrane protein [Bacteroidales bacterium Barb6XT]